MMGKGLERGTAKGIGRKEENRDGKKEGKRN
jgi:hypothetical protein